MKITRWLFLFGTVLLLSSASLAGCNQVEQLDAATKVETTTYKSRYTEWVNVKPVFFSKAYKSFDASEYVPLDGYYSLDMKVPNVGGFNSNVNFLNTHEDWYSCASGNDSYVYYNIINTVEDYNSPDNDIKYEYMTLYKPYCQLCYVDADFVMNKFIHEKVNGNNVLLPDAWFFLDANASKIKTGTSQHGYDYITYFKESKTNGAVDALTYIRVSGNYIAVIAATVQHDELTVIDDVIDSIDFKQIWTRPAAVADDYIGWQTVEISPSWVVEKLGVEKETWVEGEYTLSVNLPTDLVTLSEVKDRFSYDTYPLYLSDNNKLSVDGCVALYKIGADFVFDETIWDKLHPGGISYIFEGKYKLPCDNFYRAGDFQKGVTSHGCEYIMYGDCANSYSFTCIKVSDKFIVNLEIVCAPNRADDAMRILNSIVLK